VGGIFLSYRRDDTAGHTGRLTDDLREAFPDRTIFRDIDTIAPGADFVKAIDGAVGQAAVVLVVIGRRWLTAEDIGQGQRLAHPDDYVRLEITSAFEQGKLVVPVLVDGARIPEASELPAPLQPLVRHNALEISDLRWKYDLDRLIVELRRVAGEPLESVPAGPTGTMPMRRIAAASPASAARRRGWGLVAAGCLLVLAAALILLVVARPGSSDGRAEVTAGPTTVPSTSVPEAPTTTVVTGDDASSPGRPPPIGSPTPQSPSPQSPTPAPKAEPAPAPTPSPAPTQPTPTAPAQIHSFPESPDGRFRAASTGINYAVVSVASGGVVLTTIDEYGEDNEVQIAAFNADSTLFAAGYHYSHEGLYTYIGYWSTSSGALVGSKRVSGLLYSLDGQI
jgi:hypothetical protein